VRRRGTASPACCRIASAWPVIFFQRLVALIRVHDLHHLDLVELVLADHAARVAPGAAGL
jgi:hypothetical protein